MQNLKLIKMLIYYFLNKKRVFVFVFKVKTKLTYKFLSVYNVFKEIKNSLLVLYNFYIVIRIFSDLKLVEENVS